MKTKNILNKKKKGISVIIGYVLLVSFAIILGVLIYSWMKSYVPRGELECPDGISMFVENYECASNQLTLNFVNTGKFSIGGYFIRAKTFAEQEIATLDISRNITDSVSKLYPTGVKFGPVAGSQNTLNPNTNETEVYNLTGFYPIYAVEITPVRWQEEDNKMRLVSCSDAKIKEIIDCS
jgi:hypothetical protein